MLPCTRDLLPPIHRRWLQLCTEVGWDSFTLHQGCCSSATEQSHLPESSHIPDCSGDTQKRISGLILEKRDACGKRGSVQFMEGEVGNEGQHSQFTSCHGFAVNRTASGIPFAKHSLGQAPLLAPIPSLSQNFLSPYSFLYAQYLLYGMERHLQHCNNHVMLCTEIWGEAHLCSTMLVFVCICVCIVNKKIVWLSFLSWSIQKKCSLFPAACVRNTEKDVSHSFLW